MSFLSIYKTDGKELSLDLRGLLSEIEPNVYRYQSVKAEAQRERMIIIGKCEDYISQHAQRSSDHKLLIKAMDEEGWSKDVRSNNKAAFQEYKYLKENVNEPIRAFADAATTELLKECARQRAQNNGDSELSAAAFAHWKKTGACPTQKQCRAFLGSYCGSDFVIRGGAQKPAAKPQQIQQPYIAPPQPSTYDSWDQADEQPTQSYTVDVPASSTYEERSSIDSPEEMLSAHVESGVAVLNTAPASSDVQTAVTVPDIALACQADALVKTVRQFMDEYYKAPPEERRLCDQPLKQVATLLERVLA